MLRQWRRSGQSIRDFCADNKLAEPSFYSWRRTLAERDQQHASGAKESPAFVPLRVVAPAAPALAATSLEVVLQDGRAHAVRVPVGFEAASLRQLLAILEERPC
jgi:hypothetical protein